MDDKEAIRQAEELEDRILSMSIFERPLITYSSEAVSLYFGLDRVGQSRVYLACNWANENQTSGDLIGEWADWPECPEFNKSFPLYRTMFAGVEIEYSGETEFHGIYVHKLALLGHSEGESHGSSA